MEVRAKVPRRGGPGIAAPATASFARVGWLVVAVSAVSAIAAGIHVAVIPEHLAESTLFAAGFALMSLAQVLWSGVVLSAPSRPAFTIGAVVNAGIVLLWLVSRTGGLPVGPHPGVPESTGPLDAIATGCEVMAVVGALVLRSRDRGRRGGPSTSLTPVGTTSHLAHVVGSLDSLPVLLRAGFALLLVGGAVSIAGHLAAGGHGGTGSRCCGPAFAGHLIVVAGMVLSLIAVFVTAFGSRPHIGPFKERRSQ